ncbi:conserved hypothetical protein [Neospora caninum Liverpool]|uniref:FHA domain-containing protein n=1 Tax=Neospora caninum (strain Liverpool) TaxID=572307 RepID=F0VG76_NEOCL|nr:conserved hypothetical protein [Neospora caninum Liverpool]CBZ52720.1 conserved hypothetical protein [Neospora caninum Liverpool]CEL66700.1 TPA: FHA domain-containing protein [Neospora caninum Liverpool]|eukprot:XP_003882752.1 conserved hypothetical protein [Neospora caninum Liverpool]
MPCPTRPVDGACPSSPDFQSPFTDQLSYSSKLPLSNRTAKPCTPVSSLRPDCVHQNASSPAAAPIPPTPAGLLALCSHPDSPILPASASHPVSALGSCWPSHDVDKKGAGISGAIAETEMSLLSTGQQTRRKLDSEDAAGAEHPGSELSEEGRLRVSLKPRERSRSRSESGLSRDDSAESPRASSAGEESPSGASRRHLPRRQDGRNARADAVRGQGKKALSRKRDQGESAEARDGKLLKAARLSLQGEGASRGRPDEEVAASVSDGVKQGRDIPAKEEETRAEACQRGSTGWSLAALWKNCRPVSFGSGRRSPSKVESAEAQIEEPGDISHNVASAEPLEEGGGLTDFEAAASAREADALSAGPEGEVRGADEAVWSPGAAADAELGEVVHLLSGEGRDGSDVEAADGDRSPSEPESFVSCNTHISTRDGTSSTAGSRNSSGHGDDGLGSAPQRWSISGSDFPFSAGAAVSSPAEIPCIPPSLSLVSSAHCELPPAAPTEPTLTDASAASERGGSEGSEGGSRLEAADRQSKGHSSEADDSRDSEEPSRHCRRSHRLRGLQRDARQEAGHSAPPVNAADCDSSSPVSLASQGSGRRPREAGTAPRRKARGKVDKGDAEAERKGDSAEARARSGEDEDSAGTLQKASGTLRRKGRGAGSTAARTGRGRRRRGREEEPEPAQVPDSEAAGRGRLREEAKKRRLATRTRAAPSRAEKAGRRHSESGSDSEPSDDSLPPSSSSASDDSEYEEESTNKRPKAAGRRRDLRAAAAAAWRSAPGQPQAPVLRQLSGRGLLSCGGGATRAFSICGDSAGSESLGRLPGGPAVRIGSLAAVASNSPPVSDLTTLLGGLPARPNLQSAPASHAQPLLHRPGRSPFPTLAGRGNALSGVLGGLLGAGSRGAMAPSLHGAKSPGLPTGTAASRGVRRPAGDTRASPAFGGGASLAGSEDEGRAQDCGEEKQLRERGEAELGSRGSMESREATVSTVTAQDDADFDSWPQEAPEDSEKERKRRDEPGVGAEVAYFPVPREKVTAEDSGKEGSDADLEDGVAELVHISEIDEAHRLISRRVVIRRNKECLIGRDARTCDLVADCRGEFAKMVSRRHAVIEAVPVPELFHLEEVKNEGSNEKAPLATDRATGVSHEAYKLCLRDVGSMNGVAVNDVRQVTAFLRHGDIVTLGGVGALPAGRKREQPESPFRFLVRFLHALPPAEIEPSDLEMPGKHSETAIGARTASLASNLGGERERDRLSKEGSRGADSEEKRRTREGSEAEHEGKAEGVSGLRLARLKVVQLLSEEEICERFERGGNTSGHASTPNSPLGLAPLDEGAGGSLQFPLSSGGSHAVGRERLSRASRLSSVSPFSPSLPRQSRDSPLLSTPRRWCGRRGASSGGGRLLLSASQEVYGSPTGASPSPSPARTAATHSPFPSASPLASPGRSGHPLSQPTAPLSCLSQSSSHFPSSALTPLSLGPACFSQPLALEAHSAVSVSRVSDCSFASSVTRRGLSPLRGAENRKMEIIGEVTVPWNGTIARVRTHVDALLRELLKDKTFASSFSSAGASSDGSPTEEAGREGDQAANKAEVSEDGETKSGEKAATAAENTGESRGCKAEREDPENDSTETKCRLPAYELLSSPAVTEAPFKREELSWVFELAPFNPSANLAVAPCFRSINGEGSATGEDSRDCAAPVRTVSTIYLRFLKSERAKGGESEDERAGGEHEQEERDREERERREREEREEKGKCSPACGLSFDDAEGFFDPEEEATGPKLATDITEGEPRENEGMLRENWEESLGGAQYTSQSGPRHSEGLLSEYGSDEAWHE